MKQIIFFLLFLPGFVFGQTIVSDTAYVVDTTISGVRYFQEVTAVTYDNGQSSTQTGPRLDSAEFVRRAFVQAHDAMLPVAEGVRLIAMSGDNRRKHLYYSGILEAVTGISYLNGVLFKGAYSDYISGNYGGNVWRVLYDSAGVQADFFVYYQDSLNIGREITNPAQVIGQGADPIYVPGTQDRRLRFFPYNATFARANLLVRVSGQLLPAFTPLPEVRALRSIVDDAGADTGRTLFADKDFKLILIRVPVTLQSELSEE